MAVALPHTADRGGLLAYVDLLRETTVPYLQVSDTERRAVEDACNAILDHLAALRLFFTNTPTGQSGTMKPVRADDETGSYVPDPQRSLFPSLAQTSVTYAMTLRDPRVFFESMSGELAAASRALAKAKETLRALSQSRCCLLTSDIAKLQQFVQSANRRGTTESLVTKAGMRDARQDGAAAAVASSDTVTGDNLNTGTAEVPLSTKLLGIPDECIPSDSTRRSYAALIQGCDTARGWIDDLLKWANHNDDVPKAGTFHVDPSEAGAEGGGGAAGSTTSTATNEAPAEAGGSAGDAEAKKPRTRTVRVKRYEISDAWHIFGPLHDQAQLFFVSDYTTYDARLQCRLLNPDYYVALTSLIDDVSYEIRHMEARAARVPVDYSSLSPYGVFQHNGYSASRDAQAGGGDSNATLVFRPPISAFKSLRGELALYLSFCVYEDDLTSVVYYQRLYTNFLSNAQEVVRAVRDLPKPPQTTPTSAPTPSSAPPPPSSAPTAADPGIPAHLMTNTFRELQVDHSDRTAATPVTNDDWRQSPELRALLISRFESFVELRERVQYLKKGLENDIKHKNYTHHYLPPEAAVTKESTGEIRQLELDVKALDQQQRKKPIGFWEVAKASWQAIADVTTCKAEIDPYMGLRQLDPACADEVAPSKHSPLSGEKRVLLEQVQRLWKVVEIQASQLETTYPNLFDRGGKEKMLRRVNELIDKAASRSVIFDSV